MKMVSSQFCAFTLMTVLVCGAGVTLLYKWHTNKNSTAKKSDKSGKKPYSTKVKVKKNLGQILIGKNGANLKEIEDKTGATFKLEDDGQGDLFCIITAFSDDALNAGKLEMARMIREQEEGTYEQTLNKESFLIPSSVSKKLRAQPNSFIAQLCVEEDVKIQEEQVDDRSVVNILVVGENKHSVLSAKQKIMNKVKELTDLERSLDESSMKRTPRLPSSAASNSTDIVLPEREKLEPAGADGTMEVYVSALTSPHRFWMQILGPQAAALDNLVEAMTEYYNKDENRELHAIINPQVGQIVAAMFNVDGKWYRAQVQEIKANDYVPCKPVLDLYFVDYGDNCYAGTSEVFELRPDFLTLRFQAIECFLANVSPPNAIDANDNNYPDESIEKFEQLAHVARWKKLWSRVVSYRERDGAVRAPSPSESLGLKSSNIVDRNVREGSPVPGVELYDNEDGRDINIAEELIRGGFAQPSLLAGATGNLNILRKQEENVDVSRSHTPKSKIGDSTDAKNISSNLVNREKSTTSNGTAESKEKHKDILEETKSFIDGISEHAAKVVESVRQTSEDKTASVEEVKDRVAKVQNKLEETKSFIDGISKDAERLVEDAKTSAKDIKEKINPTKERVAQINSKTNSNGDAPEKSPPKTVKADEKSISSTSPLKSEIDFMPTFGKLDKTKKSLQAHSDVKNQANDFIKTERNSKNGM